MIAFIRKSLENGSLVVEDRISFQRINRGEPIIREHRIMLIDTRTDESVLVGFFKEGEVLKGENK